MLFVLASVRNMTDSSKQAGIVYLVGAGPGHPGLITRWGYELLHRCDAVAYDALIPMELIAELPPSVERYYVGKRAGKHSLRQPLINELLAKLARRGLRVVRLKGGDPFIYGRSGEEAEYLTAAGIQVIMIPGVTSASAAAALSGFSLTNRQSSSWVFLATGHAAEGTVTPVPWNMVGALPGGTIVVYMGLAKLDHVVEELLSSGLDPEVPAIAVQAASTGLQRCVEATLSNISEECLRQNLKPPALVIIGGAVRYRTKEVTKHLKPLAGKAILVTSRARIMHRLCSLLREAGAEPVPYPILVCAPVDDTEGWDRFLKQIDKGGSLLCQKEEEVNYLAAGLLAHDLDLRSLSGFKIIASGQPAESALLAHGIKPDAVLQHLAPDAIAESVSKLIQDTSLPLILVRGSFDKGPLEASLHEKLPDIIPLTVCLSSTAAWEAHWKDELAANPPDFILFAEAAEVEGFLELLGDDAARQLAANSFVAAMDESVAATLAKHGLTARLEAKASNADDFVETLIRFAG
jgi:uroporphyrinogen III methyltransferase/synthase